MDSTLDQILIVDDFADVRESLAEVLEENGQHVITAENGKAAIDVIKQQSINLVISDILMPDVDGIELVRHAKEKYPDLKIILISGGGRITLEQSDYDYLKTTSKITGVTSILNKPIKPAELLQTITELLES